MATDLAEFVGAAIALNLLFGVPLFHAGLITAVIAFAILALQGRGYRRFELVIIGFLGVIILGFLYDTLRIGFDAGEAARGFIPGFAGTESVLLATGILGATVMPHVIYLHSALTQDRIQPRDDEEKRALLRFQRVDVVDRDGPRGPREHVDADHRRVALPHERAHRPRLDRGGPQRSSRPSSAAARRSRSRWRCWPPAWRARASARTPARSSCRASSTGRSRSSCAARSRWRRR